MGNEKCEREGLPASDFGDDAEAWAKAFCDTIHENNVTEIDVGLMIGWFSNAIEVSHEIRMMRLQAVNTHDRLREALEVVERKAENCARGTEMAGGHAATVLYFEQIRDVAREALAQSEDREA